jgi:hypothetical protein
VFLIKKHKIMKEPSLLAHRMDFVLKHSESCEALFFKENVPDLSSGRGFDKPFECVGTEWK